MMTKHDRIKNQGGWNKKNQIYKSSKKIRIQIIGTKSERWKKLRRMK
jgi:hypothetical protein